jgi:multisubunit Na+/H+ antiporter MnhB subunit
LKNYSLSKIMVLLIGGLCFAIMSLLLALAYIPDLSPMAYSNFRRSGLIMAVPMIAGVGFLASIGWLWFEFGQANSAKDSEVD